MTARRRTRMDAGFGRAARAAAVLGAMLGPVLCAAGAQPAAAALDPAGTLGSYLAGNHAFKQRDFRAAARHLGEALAVQPKSRSLLHRVLISRLASGQIDAAHIAARRLLSIEPATEVVNRPAWTRARAVSTLASLSLAAGDIRLGKFDSAKARLSTVPRVGLHASAVVLIAGWAEAGLGRYDAAVAAVDELKAAAHETDDVRTFHAGLILDLADRPAAAEKRYLDAFEEASQPTARMIEAAGSLYRRIGNDEEADRRYSTFLTERNPSPAIARARADLHAGKPAVRIVGSAVEGAAEAFFGLAGWGLKRRAVDLALIYGRIALYLRPDFPAAQVLVGRILDSIDRTADAVEVYGQVDRASPLSWPARLRRATGFARLGRDEEAFKSLRRISAERPTRSDALAMLGDILRGRKRFAEAVEAYDAAIARIGTIETWRWQLLFSRGIALERSGNWPRAEKDLLAALERSPDQPYLLNYLGYSWVDQGINLGEARKMIERAVALQPRSGAIVDSLGWALYRLGDYRTAVVHLERAAALEPLDPTVNDHLGDAYWRVGRRNEAVFQWRRALNLDPEPNQVKLIEDKIAGGLGETGAGDESR